MDRPVTYDITHSIRISKMEAQMTIIQFFMRLVYTMTQPSFPMTMMITATTQGTSDSWEEDVICGNDSADLLRWHHRLNHIPMKKVQTMAEWRLLPRKLVKYKIPICTSCMFSKAIRKPWHTKPTKAYKPTMPTAPGQCVSIDQMESTTQGLIAQLRGKPTTIRYKVATIFVDQFSG
jgi:hypothetical protein